MGLSKSKSSTKSTSTTDPSSYSQPYVSDAGSVLKPGYDAATANNAKLMPIVNNAMQYSQNVMGGKYLNGNPYLQSVIDSSNRDITNGVQSQFEGAGRYGSGDFAGVLARQLADNENRVRYADYSQERAYQNASPGQLMGEVGVSAALPQAAGNTYAEAVHNLMGNYTTTNGKSTTTQSPAIGPMILQAMASAAQAAAMSDIRLKTNVKLISRDPDGLGRYSWNWRSDPKGETVHGVLAHEVKELRPHAYIPNFRDGYDGVNYAELER